jgi:hypothetical protein
MLAKLAFQNFRIGISESANFQNFDVYHDCPYRNMYLQLAFQAQTEFRVHPFWSQFVDH